MGREGWLDADGCFDPVGSKPPKQIRRALHRAVQRIIQGSLSREEISRVIRRNLARFKYCYERELLVKPTLTGKISVHFTIAATGAVAQASIRETAMNDSIVESCLLRMMRSLRFPPSRGAGIVVVTYPFIFDTATTHGTADRTLERWTEAYDAYDRFGTSKVATLLGAPSHLEREALAWWLVENELRKGYVPYLATQLVADLLVESEDAVDAERLLSERARDYGPLVEAQLRKMGASDAADRIARLTRN